MSENKSNLELINGMQLDELFDLMGEIYTNKEKGEGAVVLGVFSEDNEMGFNAAHGDFISIVALLTSIIENTGRNSNAHPLLICDLIVHALMEKAKEDEYKS